MQYNIASRGFTPGWNHSAPSGLPNTFCRFFDKGARDPFSLPKYTDGFFLPS